MTQILNSEDSKSDRKKLLDTYAECIDTVRGNRSYQGKPTSKGGFAGGF